MHAGAGTEAVEVPLTVEWTEDALRYSELNESVAYYTRQQDYAAAVQRGLTAARAGRVAEAEEHLGHAVALAHAAGRDGDIALLARVVDVRDAAGGRVRLKPDVDVRLTQSSLVVAHHTSRWGPQEPPEQRAAPAQPSAPWRHCGEEQTGAYCEGCGAHHLSAARPGAGRP
ncbi:hypothetical protein [Micromonospora sp. KLBMP9576]|uniref:hypothetical protein n=1 Tax=Micromonospora sp. KLBMP9576 TaxID=3424769 RepID=UPI003D8BB53E